MNGLLYTRFELLRAFRNRRFFLFSLAFPLILYFVIAGPNRNVHFLAGTGISAPLYYMAGLASFGTMASMISTGGRIAGERQVGWTRQLRISPLSPRAYFRAKVLTAYTMAVLSMAALFISGTALGVSLSARNWLEMIGLILVGLLPFAALGILLGHLMNVDAIGPVNGGLISLLALVSGTWFPVTHGFLHAIGQFLPSTGWSRPAACRLRAMPGARWAGQWCWAGRWCWRCSPWRPTGETPRGCSYRAGLRARAGSHSYARVVTPEELANLAHLRRARDLMDREYARPLDVAALARAALMSTAHFSRQFRATYGETPYGYLMTRRIERAKALLRARRVVGHRGLLWRSGARRSARSAPASPSWWARRRRPTGSVTTARSRACPAASPRTSPALPRHKPSKNQSRIEEARTAPAP